MLEYPEELVRQTPDEESGRLKKSVTLYELASGLPGEKELRWGLYEGKYNKYIEINTEEYAERIKYSEWTPDRMMQRIKTAGGSKG